jgi:hypothetical protein
MLANVCCDLSVLQPNVRCVRDLQFISHSFCGSVLDPCSAVPCCLSCSLPGDASGEAAAGNAGDDDGVTYDPAELTKGAPSRHLWLGNLHQRLPRSLLRSTFERFGPVEDVVTFPGRMYAFVNFREAADAAKAALAVQVSGW